jgi:hypothetical protein
MNAQPFRHRRILNTVLFALLLLLGAFEFLRWYDGLNPGDFASFVTSGEAARRGLDPHTVYPTTNQAETVQGIVYGPNINLPPTVLVYELLPPLDVLAAANLWKLLTVVMFAASVALLWRAKPAGVTPLRLAWLLGGPFLWPILSSAQMYGLIALMVVSAWLLLERGRPIAAGVLIGLLACIKPQFALWPLFLLLSGHRAAPIASILTAGLVLPLPAIVHGPDIYLQWWSAAGEYAPVQAITNVSMAGPLASAGVSWLLPVVGAILAVVAVRWVRVQGRTAGEVSSLALVLSLILSPVTWTPYLLVLLPALLSPSPWSRATVVGAALLLIPDPVLSAAYGLLPVGLVYPLALLLLSAGLIAPRFLIATPRTSPSAAAAPE